jgi:hypothetical protein
MFTAEGLTDARLTWRLSGSEPLTLPRSRAGWNSQAGQTMTKSLSLVLVLGLLLALCGTVPASAQGSIGQVEPAEVSQGDTVLLTISGSDLPQGSLVVEFFPQQIAVLDILASSASEIVVQCKVPNLAQPGDYNILVYNQLGIEAFKEKALRVRSALLTPVFTAYSPKAFVEARRLYADAHRRAIDCRSAAAARRELEPWWESWLRGPPAWPWLTQNGCRRVSGLPVLGCCAAPSAWARHRLHDDIEITAGD